MCTFSWERFAGGGYTVWFNRDELKTRPVASPPEKRELDGVAFLSPRDPRGGGTWMLVNDRGITLCLLNRWGDQSRCLDSPRSRGRLVWEMGGVFSLDEVAEKLGDLTHYRGFTLVAISSADARCFDWDGDILECRPLPPFLTSSSYRFDEVRAARSKRFRAGKRGTDFHDSPDEEPSPFSVRMNRPDAQTWSRSQINVTDRASWRYLGEQANLGGPPEFTERELRLA